MKVERIRARKSLRPPTSPNIMKMSKTTRFCIVTFCERKIVAENGAFWPGLLVTSDVTSAKFRYLNSLGFDSPIKLILSSFSSALNSSKNKYFWRLDPSKLTML